MPRPVDTLLPYGKSCVTGYYALLLTVSSRSCTLIHNGLSVNG